MPFKMPLSWAPRARSTPSSLAPLAAVCTSRAYVGLTVVNAWAVRTPCLSKFKAP